MLKFGIVGDGNDGIAPLTGCPVPVPTSKPDQYTPVTLLPFQHRPRSSSVREALDPIVLSLCTTFPPCFISRFSFSSPYLSFILILGLPLFPLDVINSGFGKDR